MFYILQAQTTPAQIITFTAQAIDQGADGLGHEMYSAEVDCNLAPLVNVTATVTVQVNGVTQSGPGSITVLAGQTSGTTSWQGLYGIHDEVTVTITNLSPTSYQTQTYTY